MTSMTVMSKEKMIKYLGDYANLQNLTMHNPNIPIGILFDKYMKESDRYEDDTREYYDTMRRVYTAYNILKRFSIIEDFLLNQDNYLSDNDLQGIEQDCQFAIKPSDITNKKIVQLIRNAFNHNDSDEIERFKISETGRYFEVEFKDIRTDAERDNNAPVKPIKFKFNIDYLLKVYRIINSKRQNQLFLSFNIPEDFNIFSNNLEVELSKITFIHYYFKRKMSRETIEEFNRLADTEGLTSEELLARSEELHKFSKTINEPVEFHLTSLQIAKLKDLIVRYKNNYHEMLNDDINGVMYYFLSKVIPVPAMKITDIEQQIFLCEDYFEDTTLSLNEVLRRIARILNGEDKPSTYDSIDSEIHNALVAKGYSYSRSFFKNLLDGEFVQFLPVITYIDAIITCYCKDEEIVIAGRRYNREKIRNSLVHGRWYISHKFKIIMFDAKVKNIKDYDLEEVGRIDIRLFKEWADNYMEKSTRENKKTK